MPAGKADLVQGFAGSISRFDCHVCFAEWLKGLSILLDWMLEEIQDPLLIFGPIDGPQFSQFGIANSGSWRLAAAGQQMILFWCLADAGVLALGSLMTMVHS
ncbi:hypothetical protein Nepgr_004034 [Nepenthes gracilis]|uniref:Uncharacterized protein n=1 Tax=Nepenthes gracilis TaxID=150966 RepID=A0AAD3S0M3_NEPGR|nr:hypothetical protein Nepgr_004034 [Nepenthes gracilis]